MCVCVNIINTFNRRLTYANNLTAHDFSPPPSRHATLTVLLSANVFRWQIFGTRPQVMQLNGFNYCGRSHSLKFSTMSCGSGIPL